MGSMGKGWGAVCWLKVPLEFLGGVAHKAVGNRSPGSGVKNGSYGNIRIEVMVLTLDHPRRVCVGKKDEKRKGKVPGDT